jgi:predicted MFS family arabinose efflux permease
MAGSAAALFAARAGQGLGAAMLSPAALSIITSRFHGTARAKALAAWGAVGGAGAALGVLLGGVITELVDWRLIFFVNLPVAAALGYAARKVVPADTERPRWRGLDLRGAALATGSLAAIVYAITQAAQAGWTSGQTLGIGGAGVLGLIAFAICERRTAQPLLRIEHLRDRAVGGGLLLCLINAGLMFGLFLLCSLYLQLALGRGPLPTGLAFIPLALAAGSGSHVAGHLLSRHGLRWASGPALALAAVGLVLLSRVPAHGSYLHDMLPGMLMAGFGLGLSGTAMAIGVLTSTRHEEAGMLSGASATGHEIGGTLGIAIYASIATAASSGIFAGPAAAAGIAHAFLIAAHVALGAGVAAAVLLPAATTFLPKLRLNPQAIAAH